jgi:hypothetical protein
MFRHLPAMRQGDDDWESAVIKLIFCFENSSKCLHCSLEVGRGTDRGAWVFPD